MRPFHIAIPVTDKKIAHDFYKNILGCSVGRQAEQWIDFNFFGHQLVAHITSGHESDAVTNKVDREDVPSRHFGLIMHMSDWKDLLQRLTKSRIKFLIKPQVRFQGQMGEQSTFFILDPFGNALEFKAFVDDNQFFKAS